MPNDDKPAGPAPVAPAAAPPQPSAEAFGIFEGGGAKGIAHVGALKAAQDDLKIKFVGYAGTSAGAIVAALAAAGYTADDLINFKMKPPEHALRRICNVGPLGLFGIDEWNRFSRFRWFMGDPGRWPGYMSLPKNNWFVRLLAGAAIIPLNVLVWIIRLACWTLFALCVLVRYFFRLRSAVRSRGWFDTALVRKYINALLHDKLLGPVASADQCADVLFRHLPLDMPLRIVATDIETRRIKVFTNTDIVDHLATPDVAIADAVCASISVPFVFSPKALGDTRYLDGGMVSNLPVWLFDEERLERPELPTLAFTLVQRSELRSTSLFEFLSAIASSAVFGGQIIGRRGIDNLIAVQVPTNLDLLAFDANWDQVRVAYETAREWTRGQLVRTLVNRPQAMNGLCQQIHQDLAPLANGRRIRVNIVRQVSPRYLRVQYKYNMDNDPDDNAFLPIDRSISGEVCRTKEIVCRVGAANMRFVKVPNVNDKYREAMLWKDLESVISIPIFGDPKAWDLNDPSERPTPMAVLNIDADNSLEDFFEADDIIEYLKNASIAVANALD